MEMNQRLSWLRGLVGRLHRQAAGALWSAVALSVLGQLALLLTMFLPFQVMFMLATRQLSRYLAWLPADWPFNALVIALVLATLALYGLHLLCGRWAAGWLAMAAERVLQHGNKLALFKDDKQQARDLVRRLVQWCVAGILWVVYAGLGMGLDAPVFVAVLLFAALHLLLAHRCLQPTHGSAVRWRQWLQARRARAFAVWGNSLFFFGFLLLFLQFLHAGRGDVLTAILALLLLRQMTLWMSQWALGLTSLPGLRHRADALFDPQQHYAPPPTASAHAFLAWLAPASRDAGLRQVLQQVIGVPVTGRLSCVWNDTGHLGLAAFDVDWDSTEGPECTDHVVSAEGADCTAAPRPQTYFVRCFAQVHRHLADHEARLFESHTPPPMAPRYLGRSQLGGISVLVFEGLPRQRPEAAVLPALRRQVHQACAATVLDAQLASAYVRTHTTLGHRLDAVLLQRMGVTAHTLDEQSALVRFEQALPAIRQRLAVLDCVLENPEVSLPVMRVDGAGQPVVWQWHRWKADVIHPQVPQTAPPLLALATVLGQIDRAARNGRPAEALHKLPHALALWEAVEQTPGAPGLANG